jgi:predicted nucleic acid-binding protein
MRRHVLDASALYRYLKKGDGAEIVIQVALISAVNWGEVFHSLAKRMGLGKTETLMAELQQNVPLSVVGVTPQDALSAARLKAQYHIPYADAFAVALTGTQRVLVTADVSHFERVPKLRLLKLPRAKKAEA